MFTRCLFYKTENFFIILKVLCVEEEKQIMYTKKFRQKYIS